MAELQLALFPYVDSVVAAAKHSVTDSYDSEVSVHQSPLEHLENSCQHEFPSDKEESLKNPRARKSQSYSYPLSAESNKHSSQHGGSSSAGLQNKHLASQVKTLPSKSLAKRKEGVDRSCPLKPIFQHNTGSLPAVNTGQLGSSPYMEEALNSRTSTKSKGRHLPGKPQLAAVLPPWTAEPKQSDSSLYRRDLAYILRLEAEGRSLEEEIRKKEALLREKLRRTKEELRRIQREKELMEAEERRARAMERTRRQKAMWHPGEESIRFTIRTGDGDFSGMQSAEVTVPKTGTTLHPQELAMGKLKKERLVASNNKIRDRIPVQSLASCSELDLKHGPSSSVLSDCGDSMPAEMLYMQAASPTEKGELGQCSFCGRKFLCTRLKKHMNICSKSQGSKRKTFDSSKARARGTDLEEFQQRKSSERPQNKPPRRNNWRQNHEAFIQTLRHARQVQQVLSKGGKVPDLPPLPPIENPDYTACPYCRRRFAPQVAETHIPKCKNIKNRPPFPPQRKR
ncbi:zinc finger C2HC domain-containing protein 1C [Lagopus leucura]|uniref:zinc finger C2HC domain-containing protein 1C n=1 Tax=Lagopus leucura TaxID=30410 RepID=UPI001C6672B4|nr:zinc finger C2HC domain-containing protein 1C [Lagopus leucura]XP_042726980.1 zinc finger C2HC domain-containing protein 1C [Lagopus leucura]